MRRIARRLFCGMAMLGLIIATSSFAGTTDFSSIERRLDTECSAGSFSGIVLVTRPAAKPYEHVCGSADLARHVPMTADTRFKLFSTTKTLTAIAVMRLVESGKLKLNAPVIDYIPEAPKEWSGVTIRHLLQHTSGLPDQTERLLAVFKSDHRSAMTAVLAEDRAAGMKPETLPGAVWKYNNFGYELLAAAAANVAHMPFDAALQTLVFTPAGMNTAIVEKPLYVDGKPGSVPDVNLAQGYNGTADKPEPAVSYEFIQLGAGSVHATAQDFVALDAALKAGKLLRPETLRSMASNLRNSGELDRGPRGYGLGLMVRGTPPLIYIGHDGGNNGFVSDFERYPDGTMLIVMSNFGFAQIEWVRAAVAEALNASGAHSSATRSRS